VNESAKVVLGPAGEIERLRRMGLVRIDAERLPDRGIVGEAARPQAPILARAGKGFTKGAPECRQQSRACAVRRRRGVCVTWIVQDP